MRLAGPRRRAAGPSDLARTPMMLNGVLEAPLALEAAFVRRGGRIPAGLSLLAVLRNPARSPRPREAVGAGGPVVEGAR